jgi:2-oxoglutarate dehydrogenase E1 component
MALPMDVLPPDLGAASLPWLEELYRAYLRSPDSVEPGWREWFARVRAADGRYAGEEGPRGLALEPGPARAEEEPDADTAAVLQHRVERLVRDFRVRGHRRAALDPLGRRGPRPPELDPAFHGLRESDLDRTVSRETVAGDGPFTVRGVIERLHDTYCRSIGAQFMHIDDLAVRQWLQDRMEASRNRLALSRAEQLRILTRLTDAVIFEEFVQRKYAGAKSFSLEGAESLIPLLDLALEKAGELGVDEVVIGMAHRGRLNVLANVLGKSARRIFREFEDVDVEPDFAGDVKYHLGHSSTWPTAAGRRIHLSLCFNPSHLEFVNPVALGRMRAKMDAAGDLERRRGLVLLIHGDASFAGEGIVQETLNLSELPAYATGGTLHVIVNNQIGFTTPPEQARSSVYATDVAKMLQVPVFHVNGEDPEAVAQVVRLALDFRSEFRRDVVIDMYCYRRRGHNEGDEPGFTQPLLYAAIRRRRSVRESYVEHLLEHRGVAREEAEAIARERRARLEQELSAARSPEYVPRPDLPGGVWDGYVGGPDGEAADAPTAVPRERLVALLERLAQVPSDFRPHPKIARLLEQRRAMARGEVPLDWAAAEALAFATLATEGVRVRLTGQDSERGTFSHRHALLHDAQDGRAYAPLAHLAPGQAPVEIVNSPLSETGVLGFEYGYSLDAPGALVLWEAQFGDFLNVAQPIVDQILASAEEKWRRLSGLVLLLPHGYEGAGPEHSSARPERFLELAAKDSFELVQPTTPAQYFHALRRQALRRWRKPLVVLTPKSLLRSPHSVSSLDELSGGGFERVLGESEACAARRVLLCSGRVCFDLAAERERRGAKNDVAIVRLEQLHPLREELLRAALEAAGASPSTPVFFVQDEPENMGAWPFLVARFGDRLPGGQPLFRVARPACASPATGSAARHRLEQRRLLDLAFS